jgi:WD40-like Beta Propeller Repeat
VGERAVIARSSHTCARAELARAGLALGAALLAGLVACACAGADLFGPISLASVGSRGGPIEQVEYAHDPAISADGRYIAFDGSVGGATGVWRISLATHQIQQVAGGGAKLPSISADGQNVSFTTNEGTSLPEITDGLPLQPGERKEAVNVYVRDMSKRPAASAREEGAREPAARAFTVASAVTIEGVTRALSYEGTVPGRAGSIAVGRSAISADGNEVAFVTTARSDLLDPGSEPTTPAYQVAVRYLAQRETKLVSRCYVAERCIAPAAVWGEGHGAVYPGEWRLESGGAERIDDASGYPTGASISADGSTVAWLGENIEQQAPLLAGERHPAEYAEPLWRRIAPGSETPTERVTGGSDPLAPACVASGEPRLSEPASADPCQGPFDTRGEEIGGGGSAFPKAMGNLVPRLSADGYTVVFESEAPLVPVAEANVNGHGDQRVNPDLYLADMHPGLTRAQALTPLTELGSRGLISGESPITDFDISPDGTQVAFTTWRTQFPLDPPLLVSAPLPRPGIAELYDVDRLNGTMTRVTQGYEGAASEEPHESQPRQEDEYGTNVTRGAQSPSFSADGVQLAFSSTADDLVYGDGNTQPARSEESPLDGSDVFVVERTSFPSLATPQYITAVPPAPSIAAAWTLGATALSRRDGSVLVYVRMPGAGSLRANVEGAVPVKSARRHRRGHARRTVATRWVAGAGKSAAAAGLLTLTLRLAKRYSALASLRGGLSATVSLAFSAPGHATLRSSLEVDFRRRVRRSHRAAKARAKRHRGARR